MSVGRGLFAKIWQPGGAPMLTQGRNLAGPGELFAPNSASGLTNLQKSTRVSGWCPGHLHEGVRVETPALGAEGASLNVTRGMLWGHKATLSVAGKETRLPVVIKSECVQVELPNGHQVRITQKTSYPHGHELHVNVAAPLEDASVEFRFADQPQPQVTRASSFDGLTTSAVELRSPGGCILGDYLAVSQECGPQRTVFDPLGAYRSEGIQVERADDFTSAQATQIKARVLDTFDRTFSPFPATGNPPG